MIADGGLPVETACRTLEVSVSGYYRWRSAPPSQRAIRHAWLTDVAREVHDQSRQAYGARRVHAELVLGRGITVGLKQVELVMRFTPRTLSHFLVALHDQRPPGLLETVVHPTRPYLLAELRYRLRNACRSTSGSPGSRPEAAVKYSSMPTKPSDHR